MMHWHSGTCKANNILIHYTRTGGNKPSLVLLHGLITNGLCWTNLAKVLEEEYDVIMPDARGHGLSEAPDSGYDYENLARDVAGLIEVLGISSPIVLGHSMGGMTAATFAANYPNNLRKLILVDPAFLSEQVQREVYESDVREQHLSLQKLSIEELVAEGKTRHPHRSGETLELYAQARLQMSVRAFGVLTPPLPHYEDLMHRITVPCLLVYSGKGIVTHAVAQRLRQISPELQIEFIRDAGHSPHLDQSELFESLIKKFLFDGI